MSDTLTTADLSLMLHAALIEIRAAGNLQATKWYADVFHNVPMELLHGRDPEDIYSRMDACAKRWEKQGQLETLREWAIKRR